MTLKELIMRIVAVICAPSIFTLAFTIWLREEKTPYRIAVAKSAMWHGFRPYEDLDSPEGRKREETRLN